MPFQRKEPVRIYFMKTNPVVPRKANKAAVRPEKRSLYSINNPPNR